MIEDSFSIDEVVEDESIAVSKRTVRDTMKTMAELGWLEEQTVNTNQWQQGPLMTEDMDSTSKKQHQGPTPIDQVDQTRELEGGEVYVGTVDKASSNALIWLDEPHGSHINLGPIDESVVGEEVRFRNLQGVWGKCLDEEYTYDGYNPKEDGSSSSSSSHRSSKTSSHSSGDGTITDKDPDNKNKLLKGNL
ncbi:hypothetical protein [Haloarcula marismortui]|uniref:hypothetical protein n=1 Tax=Haloarcula marismortui TaxID=2238 RepID=UPI0012680906|nr:hypothetical protein [Haloarcula californiae]